MKKTARKLKRFGLKNSIIVLFILGFFCAGAILLWAATLPMPDLESFAERKVEQSTKIYDSTGETLLYDLHANIQRTVVSFEEISRHAKNATVAIEDVEFYEHSGVKPTAFLRAVIVNIFALGFEQGGSTITQQVVKNSLLTQEKLISRKIKEWALAIRLEQVASKEEILELYLNEVPYGGSIYGIEEASRSFFNVSASELSLAQSAYLAALPQAPTYYSPYGTHREELEARKNLVLSRMRENGFISPDEYERARDEVVEFEPRRESSILAPHFVFHVREELERRYGQRALEERGFRVITTLDWELQEKAQEIVKRIALENEENFNAENAAIVAIEPQTGGILAMVGSRDYFDEEIDGAYNIATAYPGRQPGSAFKPFVYAAALKKGYTPETVVFDVETQFSTSCSPDELESERDECYAPGNYDEIFRGPVTFRDALAQSINVPAVKVLYLAGLPESLRLAKDLGIGTLTDPNRYGLTLVLGGGEVRLLDITSAYGVFANEGIRHEPRSIARIEDADGNVIESFDPSPSRVLDERVARQISDMLSDNVARTPAFGANSPLYFPGRDVAAKTGTTNDFRDAWIVGYAPNIAIGAWAGNNDNTPMAKKVAGFVIAPLWNEVMRVALAERPQEQFATPRLEEDTLKPMLRGIWQGGESYFIDTLSGKLATEHTPPETKEERFVTEVHSILYWLDKDKPRGERPENPASDPQFPYWEAGVERYKRAEGLTAGGAARPTSYDDIHVPERFPSVAVATPQNGASLERNDRVVVSISTSGYYPARSASFYLDGSFIGSSESAPFSFSFVPSDLAISSGTHRLRVVLKDAVYNRAEATIDLFVR